MEGLIGTRQSFGEECARAGGLRKLALRPSRDQEREQRRILDGQPHGGMVGPTVAVCADSAADHNIPSRHVRRAGQVGHRRQRYRALATRPR